MYLQGFNIGIIESLQKKIDRLDRILKFYQSLLIAIMSGIIWSIYALLEHKASDKILILAAVGMVVFIFLAARIKSLDLKQNDLIDTLENTK